MQKKNKRLRSRHLFFVHVLTRMLICEANQKAAKQRAFEFMRKGDAVLAQATL